MGAGTISHAPQSKTMRLPLETRASKPVRLRLLATSERVANQLQSTARLAMCLLLGLPADRRQFSERSLESAWDAAKPDLLAPSARSAQFGTCPKSCMLQNLQNRFYKVRWQRSWSSCEPFSASQPSEHCCRLDREVTLKCLLQSTSAS